MKFLIIDGYSEKSRENLRKAGMSFACDLYAGMLKAYLPKADYVVFHPSDEGAVFPGLRELEEFDGIMWTGADLNINHLHVQSITAQIELAKNAYEAGVPSFGSCWGIQMAAVAAGGTVEPNPLGREMGIGRKIILTDKGRVHPMMEGKPRVFDGFESHYDMVVQIPEGGTVLATNEFTSIQAMAVTHKRGTFWGTQYHPEYNLHEMARLIVAREEVLIDEGFFAGHDEMQRMVDQMEKLHEQPESRNLRWQLGVGDDILDVNLRQRDFKNWIDNLVKPYIQRKEGE